MQGDCGRLRLGWSLTSLAVVLVAVSSSTAQPRFTAPHNEQQLRHHIEELRSRYAPYLRSLPEEAELRPRTSLNGEWQFTFEVKDPPKRDTLPPPAPDWHGVDFDDTDWEATTVPEWRYRTVGHDNLYTRKVDQVQIAGDNRNTSQICWYRREFTADKFTVDKPAGGERLWLCFDGVAWEAQAYLNGELIGSHSVYHEPFRFDVTGKIKPGENTLAVRVINGKVYGQPLWGWTIFPDIRAERQRYTPDRAESIQGNLPIGYHSGAGFGIWRDVYLERTGPVRVDEVFVRNDLSEGTARIKVELDAATARKAKMKVRIMPENCGGKSHETIVETALPAGASVHELTLPMPGANPWSPDTPNLYRCRVSVEGDTKDALFGCRNFTLVNRAAKPPKYTFAPVKARWLRIAGRGSDQSTWNSIWEVAGEALVRDPKSVTTSGQHKDYPAALAVDGKEDTRWAVDGDAWIQFPLDSAIPFDELTIGWYEGHIRRWDFDLLVSNDGQEWTTLQYKPTYTDPADRIPNGMPLLNGKPCYLRGTNVQGFNAYAYWGQRDKLLHAVLMLKAGHFNAIRVCQHVQMPEVREILDRLGIMSQQDQGAGSSYAPRLPIGIRAPHYLQATKALTRITYNNPGVVLLSLGNEGDWSTAHVVRAGLEIDPQRIYAPISGRFTHSGKAWDMPAELRPNAIDDGHPYSGWYGGIRPQTWQYESPLARNSGSSRRMVTLGEFGAEAMDAYETMKTYPPQFAPPPADEDTLWACSQVQKHDIKQIVGFGRKPTNLGEYIEASQNYQESLLADRIIQMRLLPRGVAGYFHFHFMDVVPVFWPKSIVSHDHRPKKAYYQIAQINQPVVVLPRLAGHRPDAMALWVCNDLNESFQGATVSWTVRRDGKTLIDGRKQVNVAPLDATEVETVDLKPATWEYPDCELYLKLTDAADNDISHYRRHLRCVPKELLDKDVREHVKDPFN